MDIIVTELLITQLPTGSYKKCNGTLEFTYAT